MTLPGAGDAPGRYRWIRKPPPVRRVDVLFAERGSAGVTGVMEPGVLGDSCLGSECHAFFAVVVSVDRPSIWPAPYEVPVLPDFPGRLALVVLVLR